MTSRISTFESNKKIMFLSRGPERRQNNLQLWVLPTVESMEIPQIDISPLINGMYPVYVFSYWALVVASIYFVLIWFSNLKFMFKRL